MKRIARLTFRKPDTKRLSYIVQAFMAGPQSRVGGEPSGRQQMHIDKTDALTHKTVGFNKKHNLLIARLNGTGEVLPKIDQLLTVLQIPARQLANNHWVDIHLSLGEQLRKRLISTAKVIDPNRHVNQNHCFAGLDWRRGMALSRRMVDAFADRQSRVKKML